MSQPLPPTEPATARPAASLWSLAVPAELRMVVTAADEAEGLDIIAALACCGAWVEVTLPTGMKCSIRLK